MLYNKNMKITKFNHSCFLLENYDVRIDEIEGEMPAFKEWIWSTKRSSEVGTSCSVRCFNTYILSNLFANVNDFFVSVDKLDCRYSLTFL